MRRVHDSPSIIRLEIMTLVASQTPSKVLQVVPQYEQNSPWRAGDWSATSKSDPLSIVVGHGVSPQLPPLCNSVAVLFGLGWVGLGVGGRHVVSSTWHDGGLCVRKIRW